MEQKDGKILCHVRDQGCGISRADREHIFDAFYQGGSLLTSKPHGLGLGLNIAKQLCDQMDIALTVESREHQGTTATLSFNT